MDLKYPEIGPKLPYFQIQLYIVNPMENVSIVNFWIFRIQWKLNEISRIDPTYDFFDCLPKLFIFSMNSENFLILDFQLENGQSGRNSRKS